MSADLDCQAGRGRAGARFFVFRGRSWLDSPRRASIIPSADLANRRRDRGDPGLAVHP